MNRNRRVLFFNLFASVVLMLVASVGLAQDKPFFSPPDETEALRAGPRIQTDAAHPSTIVQRCRGPVSRVLDTAYEGVKTTSFNWSSTLGGGESGRYDKTPVLTTSVNLAAGTCLNAHFSAIVGSRQTYGPAVASITMFQVTVTPAGGVLHQHIVGHYDTPYGLYGPAVAVEAERDVDTFGSNFFQRVGFQPGDVPPGLYTVNVWWSGGPVGGGGAIGAAFVLKLYTGQ